MLEYLPHITYFALFDAVLLAVVLPWVIATKKETTAAVAWCLVVSLMPLIGTLLFWVFGYNHVYRPLRKKVYHRSAFRATHPSRSPEAVEAGITIDGEDLTWNKMGSLALKAQAFPVRDGNKVQLFFETPESFDILLESVRRASRFIHLEFFIFRPDSTGKRLVEELIKKREQGVEVRLLFDSVGAWNLGRSFLKPLREKGGITSSFLSLNPLRSRLQVNMRNHRKIVVIDGVTGFTGGMNIGDEYLGMDPHYGYWRDQGLRIEGPAVADLHRIFTEDWDFATTESLAAEQYFPELKPAGEDRLQIIESGPDQENNSIRAIYLAAISSARERLWVASPYFVPDSSLLDALRLARYRDVDVRLLTVSKPDHYLSYYAGRYHWASLLEMGVKVYQYQRGMMHAKIMLADGQWGFVGSANLDNRSLHLNFEAGCILHTPSLVKALEKRFDADLGDAILLDLETFNKRRFSLRLAENACRLLSPVL